MRTLRHLIVALTLMTLLGTAATAAVAQDQPAEPPSELTGQLTCSTYFQNGARTSTIVGPAEGGDLVRHETRSFLVWPATIRRCVSSSFAGVTSPHVTVSTAEKSYVES